MDVTLFDALTPEGRLLVILRIARAVIQAAANGAADRAVVDFAVCLDAIDALMASV
jgi:hypothetical protein